MVNEIPEDKIWKKVIDQALISGIAIAFLDSIMN